MKHAALCLLLMLFASCSQKSDADLFREGSAAEEKKDIPLALSLYGEAVDRFPATAYAESSQYRIAMILMNAEGEKRPAVDAQMKFFTMFPSSRRAPGMLFLAAFTYNNDLHNLDSAKLLYELFLAKYPGDEMAASASFELRTLGRSPEEVIGAPRAGDTAKTAAP